MMNSWKNVPLIALADYINGYAFKPEDHTDEGLPIIRIEQLKDDSAELDHYDKSVPEYNLIHNGDLIFSWSASLFLRIWDRGDAILNQHLFKVIPYPDIDKQYLKYCIEYNLPKLSNSSHGSTMKHITRKELKRFHVSLPSEKKEQAKIAEVIATIDHAIAQTEALIAKHQRIKTGLMQDLLTRGIDEHGQLRDPSTHRFKSTPLGMIPEAWEVTTLGSFLDRYNGFVQTGPFGSQLHAEEYVPSGIPTIMPKDITDGQILADVIDHITEEKAKSLSRHRVKPNDVIFARRGDLSRAAAISEREQGWLCGTGCFLLRAPKGKLDANWLAMTYRFPSIQRQVMANAIGSTMPNLNGQIMKGLIFAFPTFEEQVAIVERLATDSKVISQNAQRVNKLLKTKQGLMQDLLSGRVSVKVLMEG
jgi:type I restriction enzyme, S subunit